MFGSLPEALLSRDARGPDRGFEHRGHGAPIRAR